MNVLYFCPTTIMYGDNIALLNIIPYLKKMGVTPFFITSFQGFFTQRLSDLGYDFFVLDYAESNSYSLSQHKVINWLKKAYYSCSNYGIRKNVIRKGTEWAKVKKVDLIHSNNSMSNLGFLISKRLSVPHVWHIREFIRYFNKLEYFPCKYYFEKVLLGSKDNVSIFITPMLEKYWNNPENGQTIYDGVVDPHEGNNTNVLGLQKKNQLLYVGRITKEKGVENIIHAFGNTIESLNDTKLLILGDGSTAYVEYLQNEIRAMSLHARIKILGYRNNVADIMKESLAVIVGSYEGFGFITAEAMFYGCAVIGYDVGGTKVQFDNGLEMTGKEIGYRYNSNKELEKCINNVVNNPLDYDMLLRAQHVVSMLYSRESSARKVFDVYKKLTC